MYFYSICGIEISKVREITSKKPEQQKEVLVAFHVLFFRRSSTD